MRSGFVQHPVWVLSTIGLAPRGRAHTYTAVQQVACPRDEEDMCCPVWKMGVIAGLVRQEVDETDQSGHSIGLDAGEDQGG